MVAKTVVAEPQVSDGSVDHGAEVTPSLKRSAPQGIPKQGLLQDIPGGSVEPPTKPLDVHEQLARKPKLGKWSTQEACDWLEA